MIVRDEQDNLAPCLDTVLHLIDAFAIIDTGSVDNTIAVIREIMSAHGIPGEVISRPWKDFGHNRTEALLHAEAVIEKLDPKGKNVWYAMFMDADNRASGNDDQSEFPIDKQSLIHDCYDVEMRTGGAYYPYVWMVRIDPSKKWNWFYPRHEYIAPEGNWTPTRDMLTGGYIDRSCAGYRSRNKHVFLEDALELLKLLKENPDDPRAVFYSAQSFRDADLPDLARVLYQRRATMGGWTQEVYESLLHLGRTRFNQGDYGPETVDILLDAFEKCPQRLDAPFCLVRMWRLQGRFHIAWNFARGLLDVVPPKDALFMNREVHEWGFFEEAGLCAYYAGDRVSFQKLMKRVLKVKNLPPDARERTQKNLEDFG